MKKLTPEQNRINKNKRAAKYRKTKSYRDWISRYTKTKKHREYRHKYQTSPKYQKYMREYMKKYRKLHNI